MIQKLEPPTLRGSAGRGATESDPRAPAIVKPGEMLHRKRMIVGFSAVGLALVTFGAGLFALLCKSDCCLLAKVCESPPWTLFTALAAAPAVALGWYWRAIDKTRELEK